MSAFSFENKLMAKAISEPVQLPWQLPLKTCLSVHGGCAGMLLALRLCSSRRAGGGICTPALPSKSRRQEVRGLQGLGEDRTKGRERVPLVCGCPRAQLFPLAG